MAERRAVAADKAEALRKILRLEASRGFDDRAVTGGLDRFLEKWRDQLGNLSFPGRGSSPYARLTRQARAAWVTSVLAPRPSPARRSTPAGQPESRLSTPRRSSAVVQPERRPSPARTVRPAPTLESSILDLKLVARPAAEKLSVMGVTTLADLLYLFPNRHIDYATVVKINQLQPGTDVTIIGTVREVSEKRIGPPPGAAQAVVADGTGTVTVTWFRQSYLVRRLMRGSSIAVSGRVQEFRGRAQFQNPEYEILESESGDGLVHAGNLLPVYPATEGLQQRTLRTAAKRALDAGLPLVVEHLPDEIVEREGLLPLRTAIERMHLPGSAAEREAARRRVAFDELFLNQLAVQRRRIEWRARGQGVAVKVDRSIPQSFARTLPFLLTDGQRAALDDILREVGSEVPMGRLLQGEVGSGKTVVAVAALLATAGAELQGALMAPTEVLAEQHFINVCTLLGAHATFGQSDAVRTAALPSTSREVRIALLIGSLPPRTKAAVQREMADGSVDICIGTHALIQDAVEIPRLALAVVDEQHRFGVEQRAALRQKGLTPHLLAMSATPIPRSLYLTEYGDLDLSTLRELPGGRRPIETRRVTDQRGRSDTYRLVRKQVASGRQAFVVCPLIDPSEEIRSRSAVEEHVRLSEQVFPDLRVGLLHGRMTLSEKQSVMERFRSGEIQVLVATPVIEVGIDVPNATVMMIETADRFGLSQLHQLRGRVGRGGHMSYCILLSDDASGDAEERLSIVARTSDGFALAEADLRIRGPGDFAGTRQSGFANLKVATLEDMDLLAASRAEAEALLTEDPDLRRPAHRLLARELVKQLASRPAEVS